MSYTYTKNQETVMPLPAKLKSATRYGGTLLLAILCIWGARQLATIGMDWGYYLIKGIAGQPSDDQGWGALLLSIFVFPTMAAGITAGALTGVTGAKFRWHAGLLAALTTFFVAAVKVQIEGTTDVLAAGALLALYGIMAFPSTYLFREIARRVNGKNLLLAAAPALAISAFLPLLDMSRAWAIELPVYCEMLVLMSLLATVAVRAKDLSMASAAATAVLLPFIIFNTANILFTLINPLLNFIHISWQAFASAATITAVTLICGQVGALLGTTLMRLRARA